MLDMAKRTKRETKFDLPRGRARDLGQVIPMQVEITLMHSQVLDECAREQRRTKRAIVEMALETYFRQHGIAWPPEPD